MGSSSASQLPGPEEVSRQSGSIVGDTNGLDTMHRSPPANETIILSEEEGCRSASEGAHLSRARHLLGPFSKRQRLSLAPGKLIVAQPSAKTASMSNNGKGSQAV